MATVTTTLRINKKKRLQYSNDELYVRDDIVCGFKDCEDCKALNPDANMYLPAPLDYKSKTSMMRLLKNTAIEINEFTKKAIDEAPKNLPVIIIPDHSIFATQMDLLESKTPPFANIIVLRSIFTELAHRHRRTFDRIRVLVDNSTLELSTYLNKNVSEADATAARISRCHAYIFDNNIHRSTQVPHASKMQKYQETFKRRTGVNVAKYFSSLQRNRRRESEMNRYHDEQSDLIVIDSDSDEESLFTVTEAGDVGGRTNARQSVLKANEEQENIIMKAVQWIITHMQSFALVILLTNDENLSRRASAINIPVLSAAEYVEIASSEYPQLKNTLAKTINDEEKRLQNDWVYEPHINESDLQFLIETGECLRGKFTVDRDYHSQGVVSIPGRPRCLIPDFRSMNRAISGDDVVIRLRDPSAWEAPRNIVVSPEELVVDGKKPNNSSSATVLNDIASMGATLDGLSRSELDAELQVKRDDEDPDNVTTTSTNDNADILRDGVMPTADVVGIWARNTRPYCGSIEESDKTNGRVFFLPVNRSIPRILIETSDIQSIVSKRIIVAFDSWSAESRHPQGHLVKVIGEIGETQAETEVVLTEYDVRHERWSKEVESCLPTDSYEITAEELEGRVDLRNLNICSIDPPNCTDIDDALHCIRLENGEYEVGVHIADVTHYVKPGSALDREASQRSTSVYLVDRRIDMIPARLSTDICSLHENVDRLAFSTVWRMNSKADILDVRFFKSVIRSRAAFAYADAQKYIDLPVEKEGSNPLVHACRDLMHLARHLKQKRIDNGALTLASSEVKFEMDAKRTTALSVGQYQLKEANSLVEEFMLLANVSVAEHIKARYSTFALLRRHPVPAPEMLAPLVKACKRWGFDIDISSGKQLNNSLDKVISKDDPSFNKIVRMLTTRCLTQAVYCIPSADLPEKQLQHFGLAAPLYTHFTSPIRRYSDVVVHRLLAASLGISNLPDAIKDKDNMKTVVDNMNLRHRNAQMASRSSTQIWTLAFFAKQPKIVQQKAIILDVKSTGLRVIVPELGIECPIVLAKKGEEDKAGIKFDPETVTVTTSDGKSYTVFQSVMVRIQVEMDRMRRQKLVVTMIDDNEPVINPIKFEAPAEAK